MSAIIVTKFIGPTNHKPARVKAKHATTGRSLTISWDHDLDVLPNHERAMRALERTIWADATRPSEWAHGDAEAIGWGYAFVKLDGGP